MYLDIAKYFQYKALKMYFLVNCFDVGTLFNQGTQKVLKVVHVFALFGE